MFPLSLTFFAIALLYAVVGFGGGSSYIAFLALANTPFHVIPKISLLCNLVVVTGGSYHYWQKKLFNLNLMLPFVVSSVPFAFLGGAYPLKERTFMILLTVTLFLAGLRVLFIAHRDDETVKRPSTSLSLIVGAILGLLSGMVGIGGGIFLSPLMLNLRWAKAKEVAAISSAFIFLNSVAGLLGQWTKGEALPEMTPYLPLLAAVVVGGQIGSRVGTHPKISHLVIRRCTGVLILYVSARLFLKIIG